MDDQKKEMVEALETLVEYSPKLIKALETISKELRENRQPDTDEYVQTILKGMNWEIQIINATMPLLNEQETLVDGKKINEALTEFNQIFEKRDDVELANQFETSILPLFQQLEEVAKEKIA